MPTCWIIAGVNGAGKTTFALEYMSKVVHCTHFINADLIAAGLSPLAPEQQLVAASRLFLHEIEIRINKREDFAFETTLSGKSYLKLIDRLQREHWQVKMFYLALPNVEQSINRVAERVAHGGHNIPVDAINRRFSRSLFNLFNDYRYKVDCCFCVLNNGDIPQLIFEQQGNECNIFNDDIFQLLLTEAKS